tara:strand:+ start:12447 stop:12920 length:474 start_codon:yes stop_codon:yes gene_type:complete
MDNIKILNNELWKKHPWNVAKQIEQISTHFLLNIANKESTNYTDLLSGDIVHQNKVWYDIKNNGMQEPLLIRINPKTKEVRLESGNHRIKTAIKDNFTHLPCAIFITKKLVWNEGNGKHKKLIKDFIQYDKLIECPYDYQIKLSDYINKEYSNIILR